MEAFGFWMPPGVASSWVVRTAKWVGRTMIGGILGKRYRSIRDTLVPFRKDQGRGDLAACLMEIAPDFKKAKGVFNDCRYDANPRALDLLYSAMVNRLRKEGLTTEIRIFVAGENIENVDDKGIEAVISEFEDLHHEELGRPIIGLPRDLIPLIEGITMAWSKIRRASEMLQKDSPEGHLVTKFLIDEMLGDPPAVPLYAVSAPLTKAEIIPHLHEYVFDDDCVSAAHTQDERNKLTNLQVRRSDVKRWIPYYLDEK